MQSPTIPSSPPASQDNHENEAHIQFIQDFFSHQANHNPTTALHQAITDTNVIAEASSHSQVFNQTNSLVSYQLDHGDLPQQSRLSILYTTTQVNLNKFLSIFPRFISRINEIELSPRSFSVKMNTGHLEDSCYVEYVQSRRRWRAAVCPSGIALRLVEEQEFTHGCRQLISTAGCCFKTAATSPLHVCSPFEIPSRFFGSVMRSLGFCVAYNGKWYRVHQSCIGRDIKVSVTIVPKVDHNGHNRCDEEDIQGNSLLACVEVLENRSVTDAVNRLKLLSDYSSITRHGREAVRTKFTGNNSVVLL